MKKTYKILHNKMGTQSSMIISVLLAPL